MKKLILLIGLFAGTLQAAPVNILMITVDDMSADSIGAFGAKQSALLPVAVKNFLRASAQRCDRRQELLPVVSEAVADELLYRSVLYRHLGVLFYKYTGSPDITFQQLYDLYGVELAMTGRAGDSASGDAAIGGDFKSEGGQAGQFLPDPDRAIVIVRQPCAGIVLRPRADRIEARLRRRQRGRRRRTRSCWQRRTVIEC